MSKTYETIASSESYEEVPSGNQIIFLEVKAGANFIQAAKDAINVRHDTGVYIVMMPFNAKMFVVGPDTTIMSLLDDHDAAFANICDLDLAKMYA